MDVCEGDIDSQPFPNGGSWNKGHNAEPVGRGFCCTQYNNEVVLPSRIAIQVLRDKRLFKGE